MTLTDSNNDPTMNIADVAKRLNMSAHFVYRQTLTGTLQCYALGGSTRKRGAIRFSENQFQEYLEAQKNRPAIPFINRSRIDPVKCTPKPNSVTFKLNKLLEKRA